MRKILAGILASAICLSFSVSVFAASGYGSGSGSSSSKPSTGSGAMTTPTVSQVSSKADTAIKEALAAGGATASVSLSNVASLSADAIKAVASKAAAAGTKATLQVDKVVGKAVESRWYIDPTKAASLTGNINLEVTTDPKATAATARVFDKFFTNTTAVVSLGQKGSYGMPMGLAVKADLSKLNTKSLVFYTFDKATNTFAQIAAPAYFIDAKGYLHFTTSVGGDIVITDSALAKK